MENKIEVLADGTVIVKGSKAIEAWNNATKDVYGSHKAHPKLNKEENELVTELAYFPEDKNVATKLKIKNKKDKILAIALHDHWEGATLSSNIEGAQKSKAIFRKLFKNTPENLF